MYARPASPQPIGGVLDDAIKLYRASFRGCWPIAAGAALITGLISMWLTFSLFNSALGSINARAFSGFSQPKFMLGNIVNYLVQIAGYGALIVYQNAVGDGEAEPSLSDVLAVTWSRFWSGVLAAFVAGLVIGVGMVLLLVPGIYLLGALCLAPVCVFAGATGPMQALHESRELVRGHWWRTTTIATVALIIMMVLSAIVSLFAGAIFAFRHDPVALQLSIRAVSIIAVVFTLPMMPAALLAIYHDLKLRREGSDIAARLGAMAPS